MIRLSLRQFRTQGLVAIMLLAVTAILLGITGPHVANIYNAYARAEAACSSKQACLVSVNPSTLDRVLELLSTVLVAVPGLIGAFWGAPLIGRELEHGTHRLAWTQGVTRNRWLATKVLLVGAATVLATGLLSLMVTWWSGPIDRTSSGRFDPSLFGERDITPLGYAAFALVLGVAFGLLLRRTLPAMGATLATFVAVRVVFTELLRQRLLPPANLSEPLASVVNGVGQSNGGPLSLFTSANLPGAWVYSVRIVDGGGHGLGTTALADSCPALLQPLSQAPGPIGNVVAPVPDSGGRDLLGACTTKLGATYHGLVTYQPASRYWVLQSLETGIFVAAAVALAALCFVLIRRRA